MSEQKFTELPLIAPLQDNLASLGYHSMTPIQAESLPLSLAGKDVIAQAKTGSGKTAAFGLCVLQSLEVKQFNTQALVLCPTRELADQVAGELRRLARGLHNVKVLTLCGGLPMGPQLGSLRHGAHIVVGTPGRVADHLRKASLDLASVSHLVLDEADRMLEMGFQETLDAIVRSCPAQRQTLLFSATYPPEIRGIARRYQSEPVLVQSPETHDQGSIEQHYYRLADNAERADATMALLWQRQPESALVFCNTKIECDELATKLQEAGFSCSALHGDLEQRQREQILTCFATRSVMVLVATDVAARGLDIDELDLVINYHLARDPEVHVHRVGRTGRAGSQGVACSLFTGRESHKIERLQSALNIVVREEPLPVVRQSERHSERPVMVCLQLDAGKKQKIRPGDILGALTAKGGVAGSDVGKIYLYDFCAYVAVRREVARQAMQVLNEGKLKGRRVRARSVSN